MAWRVDESIKKAFCQMARVLEVYPESYGIVRCATMRTSTRKLQRPVVKLAPVFNECFPKENRDGNVGVSLHQSKKDDSEKAG